METSVYANTFGRLYTKDWVEFDLVEKGPAVFQFGSDTFEVQPGSAMFINANRQYTVSAQITRFQVPLAYFDNSFYFESRIIPDIRPAWETITPDKQPGRAVLRGISTAMSLKESDSSSLPYLEPGILYSTFESLQIQIKNERK